MIRTNTGQSSIRLGNRKQRPPRVFTIEIHNKKIKRHYRDQTKWLAETTQVTDQQNVHPGEEDNEMRYGDIQMKQAERAGMPSEDWTPSKSSGLTPR
jgi:hypothetical protein